MKGQEISMKSKNFRKGPFERLFMKFFYFMLKSLNVKLLRRISAFVMYWTASHVIWRKLKKFFGHSQIIILLANL